MGSRNETVIVTGAGGFIGSNIVRRLLRDTYTVHAFVRSDSSLWRIYDLKNNLYIHTGLLLDSKKLTSTIHSIAPDHIFHLATYGSYPKQSDVSQMIDVSVKSTLNLLEASREIPYKSFVVSGSSSEYGKKHSVMKETDLPEPNNLYGAAKAAQTMFVQAYARAMKRNAMILRLFNVYGPYEEEGRLVRSVIESAIQGKPIKLATGREARDFIFADDVADAFLHASRRCTFYGEIFNIGTGQQTTILTLAKFVVRILTSQSQILLNAYEGRPWDTLHWKASMRKTERFLKWHPKTPLIDGLKKTIQWYKEQHIPSKVIQ